MEIAVDPKNVTFAREALDGVDLTKLAKKQLATARLTAGDIEEIKAILSQYEKTPHPETDLSRKYQLDVKDNTKTVDGIVTGTMDIQYTIPEGIDLPTARNEVNRACQERGDRDRPAIYSGDFDWYAKQETEKSDIPNSPRVIKYTIDFDSKDPGDGSMTMAGHRAYASNRDSHITPVEQQSLGAALYYEKTGEDLMKDYWVRAVTSKNEAAAGVALTTVSGNGVRVHRCHDGAAVGDLVVALSPNSKT
jgi:hypothetical protein